MPEPSNMVHTVWGKNNKFVRNNMLFWPFGEGPKKAPPKRGLKMVAMEGFEPPTQGL